MGRLPLNICKQAPLVPPRRAVSIMSRNGEAFCCSAREVPSIIVRCSGHGHLLTIRNRGRAHRISSCARQTQGRSMRGWWPPGRASRPKAQMAREGDSHSIGHGCSGRNPIAYDWCADWLWIRRYHRWTEHAARLDDARWAKKASQA